MAKNNFEIESAKQDAEKNQLEVVVRTVDAIQKPKVKKYRAEWVEGDAKPTVYLAMRKEMMLFIDEYTTLQFRNYSFTTNVQQAKEYIESNMLFNIDIFKEKYPEAAAKKLEEYRSKFTRDEEEHEPTYGKKI